MLTLNELEKKFTQTFQIIVDLNVCMNNAERLLQNKYTHEELIKKHGFWVHYFEQLKFIMIIQICKVLSNVNNQKISFWKILNRLENEKYDKDLIDLLETNKKYSGDVYKCRKDITHDIKVIRDEFVTKKFLMSKVITIRDKVYAHYDPGSFVEGVTFDELRELIKFGSNLFNRIGHKLLNKNNVVFSHTRDWNVDDILYELNNSRQIKIDKIQAKIK